VSEEIQEAILAYVREELLEEKVDLEPEAPLLEGTLDSFGLMSLVSFLEDRFDVAVDVDEVTRGNFASVSAVTAFVEGKRQAA
jgi:acyl carrier protein